MVWGGGGNIVPRYKNHILNLAKYQIEIDFYLGIWAGTNDIEVIYTSGNEIGDFIIFVQF